MAILIDPPAWPAHGRLFSHMVSDTSYAELHAFARNHSISLRAFDRDHYDVPDDLYSRLVSGGATPVTGGELTRALIASGLRVPLKERPEKIRNTLLRQWSEYFPYFTDLGEHLLEQWEQPYRAYHNSAHLLEMLTVLEKLTPLTAELVLATWLHDIVYDAQPGKDEEASARFARDVGAPLIHQDAISQQQMDAVAGLIEATAAHTVDQLPPEIAQAFSSHEVHAFFDADMAILGAKTPRYDRYSAGVRQEFSHFSDEDFRRGRKQFLADATQREQLFYTEKARRLFEEQARDNMRRELQSLYL